MYSFKMFLSLRWITHLISMIKNANYFDCQKILLMMLFLFKVGLLLQREDKDSQFEELLC